MYGAEGQEPVQARRRGARDLRGAVPTKQDLEKRKDFRLEISAMLVEVQGKAIVDLLADSLRR